MFRERLGAAVSGLVFWFIMYKMITDTRLFEINAAFWPRFVVVGLGVVGLCAWRGFALTAMMMLHTIVFTVSGALLIWLLWPYLPLDEIYQFLKRGRNYWREYPHCDLGFIRQLVLYSFYAAGHDGSSRRSNDPAPRPPGRAGRTIDSPGSGGPPRTAGVPSGCRKQ